MTVNIALCRLTSEQEGAHIEQLVSALRKSEKEGEISLTHIEESTPAGILESLCKTVETVPIDVVFARSSLHHKFNKKLKSLLLVDVQTLLDSDVSGFNIKIDPFGVLYGDGEGTDTPSGGRGSIPGEKGSIPGETETPFAGIPYLREAIKGTRSFSTDFDAEGFPGGFLPDKPGGYIEELDSFMRESWAKLAKDLEEAGGPGAERGAFFTTICLVLGAIAAVATIVTAVRSCTKEDKPPTIIIRDREVNVSPPPPEEDKKPDPKKPDPNKPGPDEEPRDDGGPFNPEGENPGPEGVCPVGEFRLVLSKAYEAYQMRKTTWFIMKGIEPPPKDIRTQADLQEFSRWADEIGIQPGGDRDETPDTPYEAAHWVFKESLKGRWGNQGDWRENPIWRFYVRRFNVPFDPMPLRQPVKQKGVEMLLVYDRKSDSMETSFVETEL